MRFLYGIKLSVFLLIALTPFLARAEAGDAPEVGKCTLTQPPTTPDQLIGNIKCAVALDLLLDDEIFKDDEKVWKIFSATRFHKNYPYRTNGKTLGLSDFPNAIDKANLEALPLWQRLSIGITEEIKPPYLKGVGRTLSVELSGGKGLQLDFAHVVRLFGPGWSPVKETTESYGTANSASSGKTVQTPSEPITERPKKRYIGAHLIGYQLPTRPPTVSWVSVRFDGDGFLDDLKIDIMEK